MRVNSTLMPILVAALLYFAIVFGIGFLLGPIRVLMLEPTVGSTVAVLCEAPLLLTAMILAARWLPQKLHLPMTVTALATMGIGALILQQLADLAVGLYVRELTSTQILETYKTQAGAIYALLLVVFAAMPVVVNMITRKSDTITSAH